MKETKKLLQTFTSIVSSTLFEVSFTHNHRTPIISHHISSYHLYERMIAFVRCLYIALIGEILLFSFSFKAKRMYRAPLFRYAAQGFSSTTNQKNPPTKMQKLERKINALILKEKGLEEAVGIYRSLLDFQIANQDTVLNPFYVQKYNQFQSIKRKYGWNEEKIRRKMLEITWNSVAKERIELHQLQMESLSTANLEYIKDLCRWILLPASIPSTRSVHRLLDVGCGNGILLKFLEERSHNTFSKYYDYTGIDISLEMIKIAAKRYPQRSQQFIVQSFFDHQVSPLNSSDIVSGNNYDCIIFHECLHYFSNITEAIQHSIKLLQVSSETRKDKSSSMKRIVISHPKGIQNVRVQYSTNRLLVPSLLPTKSELLELGNIHSFNVEYYAQRENQYYLTVLTFPSTT